MLRKFFYFAALAACSILLFASCEKEKKVSYLSANVEIDTKGISDASNVTSFDVIFTNINSGYTVKVTSKGTAAKTDKIIPGIYNIIAQAYSKKYNYIGKSNNVKIEKDNGTFTVKVIETQNSALIFKEIFYAGDNIKDKKNYFKDQFYEIYNNGDEIVYADGICLGEVMSESIYDFSGAKNLKGEASDYIFFNDIIWQVPGNGKDYPIAPGESFIIAQYATNHKAADKNPNSPVDLSTAEFETYIDDYKTGQVNCNSIDMKFVCNASKNNKKQYLTSVFGTAMVIFKPSTELKNSDFLEPTNGQKKLGREVLKKDVLDAVECVKNISANKKLNDIFDAGKIWCSNSYTGESVIRKIKEKKADGRIIYIDTNNSSNDFEVSPRPEIRRNGAKRPSWSNWTTAQ